MYFLLNLYPSYQRHGFIYYQCYFWLWQELKARGRNLFLSVRPSFCLNHSQLSLSSLSTLFSSISNQRIVAIVFLRRRISIFFKFSSWAGMRSEMRRGMRQFLLDHSTALCSRPGELTLSPQLQGCKLHFTPFSFLIPCLITWELILLLQCHIALIQCAVYCVLYNGCYTDSRNITQSVCYAPQSSSSISLCHSMLLLKYFKLMML